MAKQAAVAGAVIPNEHGQYLLVQERNPKAYGKWNLPAGHVDEGETEQQAAIRETKEEVNITIRLVTQTPLHEAEDPTSHRKLVSFLGEMISGEPAPQANEILDAQWFTLDQIQVLHDTNQLRVDWVMESILKVPSVNPQNENDFTRARS